MRKMIVLVFLFLLLSGCTAYYHHFNLEENYSVKAREYTIYASATPSGHGENKEKKMEDRKFDICALLFTSIAGIDAGTRIRERKMLDDYFNVDTFYIQFDEESKLHPLAASELCKIGHIDLKNDYDDSVFRKIYYGYEFIIPDSVKTIQMTVPFYSKTPDGFNYDTLKLNLGRTVNIQRYYAP